MKPTFFETSMHFREWLEGNHLGATELLVGFWKVGSGRASMTWSESVDEALCFGWIDGVRRRVDDDCYTIRFTPRRPGSIWSRVNLAKVEVLTLEGRMREMGRRAFEARDQSKSGVYSFESSEPASLREDEETRFQSSPVAWRFFASCPPSYRKTVIHWIVTAKRPDTRQRRLDQLIEACAEERRLV